MNFAFTRAVAPRTAVFLSVGLIALLFACFTNHAWEDYYITYRSSHNLATGHGLVFDHAEKLHTFTSPIGVLLPTIACLVTGTSSDQAALWVFRLLSIGAFAGAAVLLFSTTARLRYPLVASCALVAWMATDAKTVDFTINGMETGFLLLFFAYSVWALFAFDETARRRWHLGFAWGGLMWTRPDAFIYIGLFCCAFLAFNRRSDTGASRREWLRVFVGAAAIGATLYLPWFVFSWLYYGSPVPHTIIAKAGSASHRSVWGFVKFLPNFPYRLLKQYSPVQVLFLPSYPAFSGWPMIELPVSGFAAVTAMLLWTLPWLRTETRAASLTLLGAIAYLTYFPPALFPWYLCLPCLLAFMVWAGAFSQAWLAIKRVARPPLRRALAAATICVVIASLVASGWLLIQVGRQVRVQQRVIEEGNRRPIGLWLHEHARSGDTVMLEPLGYIGYFSGLKMYDIPGLSSREVVAAIRQYGMNWGKIAEDLQPTWLVLRDSEIEKIDAAAPQFLERGYRSLRVFDVQHQLDEASCYGKPYLGFDSKYTVFRRREDIAAH